MMLSKIELNGNQIESDSKGKARGSKLVRKGFVFFFCCFPVSWFWMFLVVTFWFLVVILVCCCLVSFYVLAELNEQLISRFSQHNFLGHDSK